MTLPSYPKVLALGKPGTERALIGPVSVTEKVDGNQFRFGIDETGTLVFGSHRTQLYPGNAGDFEPLVQYLLSRKEFITDAFDVGVWFFGEHLRKPKQVTLKYGRVPQNDLVLFDVYGVGHGYQTYDGTAWLAEQMGFDVVPELYHGETTLTDLQALLDRESFLGGVKIEGVVIKNYTEQIMVGGQLRPVFAKLVRPEFLEQNKTEWHSNSGKSQLETYLASFATEARWRKAVQHLDERGELKNAPQDIGPLMKEVYDDLDNEEAPGVKNMLYQMFKNDLHRTATRGLPDWYKAQLVKRVE